MKDIEILEKELRNIRNLIDYYTFESLDYDKKYRMERFKTAIENILKERQADKEKINKLEADNYECNNRINDCIETINKIQEEFLKYDWKNSNNEQIYNQLKSLYNEIFKETEENRK